jgi:hypothetical protein
MGNNKLYEANLLLGQGADTSLAGPAEALMSGGFVAIYIYLGLLLADAPVLSGDDTPSLVLEVAGAPQGWQRRQAWLQYLSAHRARGSGRPKINYRILSLSFGQRWKPTGCHPKASSGI